MIWNDLRKSSFASRVFSLVVMTESSTYSPVLSRVRVDAQATKVISIRSTKQLITTFFFFIAMTPLCKFDCDMVDCETFSQSNLQRGVIAMKKKNVVMSCLVLLMLITLVACASTRTRESTGEYVDDSVITTKEKTLLANDDFLKSFQIGVETFQGTVQLSGFVNSQKAVDKAGEIVRSVKGVKSIKNNLIVKK